MMEAQANYTALVRENRTAIDTNAAAFHLGRKPQTLRKWACHEDGPLRPIRINGRLAWSVDDIKRLLTGGQLMEKAQLPVFAELSLGDTEDFTAKPVRKFTGTTSPRHLRVLHALLVRPLTREQLDRTAGASNGPELASELRRRGLALPCPKTPVIDRDGCTVQRGVYSFTENDSRQVRKFFAEMRRAA